MVNSAGAVPVTEHVSATAVPGIVTVVTEPANLTTTGPAPVAVNTMFGTGTVKVAGPAPAIAMVAVMSGDATVAGVALLAASVNFKVLWKLGPTTPARVAASSAGIVIFHDWSETVTVPPAGWGENALAVAANVRAYVPFTRLSVHVAL